MPKLVGFRSRCSDCGAEVCVTLCSPALPKGFVEVVRPKDGPETCAGCEAIIANAVKQGDITSDVVVVYETKQDAKTGNSSA